MFGRVWGFAGRATGFYDIYNGVKKLAHCDLDRGGKRVMWGVCKLGLISSVVCQVILLSQTKAFHEKQYQIDIVDEETVDCSSEEFTQQLNQCFNIALSFFRMEERVGKNLFFDTLKEECFQLTKLVSSCGEENTRMLNFRNFVISLADNV